jgi:ABC-2 type transport system permease protein
MTAAEPSASRALRTGLVHEVGALAAIAQRDLTKLLRDRLRLAVSLALPVALILGIGNILQPTVGRVTGLNAVTLAFTGVLAATLFQSAAAGMISLVEDRDTDFSRELFVTPSPASRLWRARWPERRWSRCARGSASLSSQS